MVYADATSDENVEGGGFSQLQNALQNWLEVGSRVTWEYGGTQTSDLNECADGDDDSPGGYADDPFENLVVFNDPCDQIAEPRGGALRTLAIGGAFTSGYHVWEDETWASAVSLYVVVDNDTGLGAEEYEQMLTHELGHTLGFDHTEVSNSVMAPTCCSDITDVDEDCALFTYGVSNIELTPTPVELAGFEVQVDESAARLTWQTASETNNSGFQVQHALEDAAFAATGFVDGHGTTAEPQHYAFTAADLLPGRHRFRLKQIDLDGGFEYSPEVEVVVGVPEAFVLSEAYPNPFNPRAQFTLAIAAAQHVRVAVYDVRGRQVALLHDGMLEPGRAHRFTLEADGLPSGVYFYRALGETFQAARPATLLK